MGPAIDEAPTAICGVSVLQSFGIFLCEGVIEIQVWKHDDYFKWGPGQNQGP